jgi:hypothetical protein
VWVRYREFFFNPRTSLLFLFLSSRHHLTNYPPHGEIDAAEAAARGLGQARASATTECGTQRELPRGEQRRLSRGLERSPCWDSWEPWRSGASRPVPHAVASGVAALGHGKQVPQGRPPSAGAWISRGDLPSTQWRAAAQGRMTNHRDSVRMRREPAGKIAVCPSAPPS